MDGTREALEALEARVGLLEGRLCGTRGSPVLSKGLCAELKETSDALLRLLQTTPDLQQLLNTPSFVKSAKELEARPAAAFAALPSASQVSLVLAAEDDIRAQATQLEHIDALKAHASADSLSDVVELAKDSKLASARQALGKQSLQAVAIHDRVNQVLDRYNTIAAIVSNRFLEMSRKLDQWEAAAARNA